RESYGLPDYDAEVLTDDRDVSEFFESAVKLHGQPKTVSNWVMRDALAAATEAGKPLRELPVTPEGLVELLRLVGAGGHTAGGARGVRGDGEDGGARGGNRARARARGGVRRGRARGARPGGDRGERAAGREVQGRRGEDAELLRRPGDEAHRRQGRPRAPARG